jgi:hypothetical protein
MEEALTLQFSCGVLSIPPLLAKGLLGLSDLTLSSSKLAAKKIISRFTGAILEEVETEELD